MIIKYIDAIESYYFNTCRKY